MILSIGDQVYVRTVMAWLLRYFIFAMARLKVLALMNIYNLSGKTKKMEHIKNFAQINEELLSVALSESKSKYLEASKKNKSYVLHEWTKEDRINFVRRLVSSYLNNSKAQADD